MIVNAKVVFKDYLGGGETTGVWVRGFRVPIGNRCRVTFELEENHKNIILIVPEKVYSAISVGSTGALEFHGKNFGSFEVGKTVENTGETKKRKFKFRM